MQHRIDLHIVVQMASPSATFILESVVRGHHIIYKLDVGYRRRLMVVLSTIDNNKTDCVSVAVRTYVSLSTWHCHVINVL